MSGHTDNAGQEVCNVKQESRNFEAFGMTALFSIIWLIPYMKGTEAGGLGGMVIMFIGTIETIVIALLLFFPLRWLIRLSLDGEKKLIPRLVLFGMFSLLLTYVSFNLTPGYVKNMEQAANEYYYANPHEFENPIEGKTIDVDIMNGPYFTQFIFTETRIPIRSSGGTIVDYKNGWYFEGIFLPN